MRKKKLLVSVVGPTAVGKTAVTIDLANAFDSEIISADSRQFYREMELGTAKPSAEELSLAPHHFINTLSVTQEYSVGQFEKDAISLLDELFQKHEVVFMAGGSGLFVDAVCNGLDKFPEIDPAIREKLNETYAAKGIAHLQSLLKERDPTYYVQVDVQNPQRLIRALEVIESTGEPFSSFRRQQAADRPFEVLRIGLEMDREKLYERIDMRMDLMIAAGLFEEAERLYQYRSLNALQTVGYKEIFGYLDGEYDKEEAVRLLKRNSRRYAKRQLTWFRRNESVHWFSPNQVAEIKALISEELELLKTKN
ncbi:tRNA dimethylallyltransferase [Roseivirga pacifica]|uniref:tRNA dimethylallyltransferase n=1 Tax=Roseivirga pacifica TaxID=1267423 RepID=A0A1I0RCM9_9BACT|nr:tRNA (adenosine(37)-N6)-dimethylallyltransferase MiaA [Roseivirga pacifica]RKQ49364.1 tRNA dimethylallyltransferase [Roseivirga pacifica]SEW38349.1 tRNA dimethylallyltransferase [Roseivirga pacifica]